MRRRANDRERILRRATLGAVFALTLLAWPWPAVGEDKKDEPKVSNDDPARPFQLPPATPEVKEALDDFDRFGRRGAWERALKSLYSIPEPQTVRFIDGEHGFVIPVSSKRRALLAALPTEGLAAYKTFHDVDAKKLYDEADGRNQLTNLEKVYSSYFSTSVGDNAADRLGDLYFELGRFDRAADCWLTILRDRPDTDLSLALVSLKAALALHRAGRRGEFEQIRTDLKDKHDDETVTVGGETGKPTEVLKKLIGDDSPSVDPAEKAEISEAGPDLGGLVDPSWQVKFAQSVEAGMTPLEMTQWESNSLSVAVPAIGAGGPSLYVNYLGYAFALDAKSGKMLWRSGSFHMLDVLAMQQQAQMIEPTRFAVVASDELAWFVSRDLKEQNMFAPFRLSCRRTSNGDVVWKTDDLADYATIDLFGPPLLVDGKLYIVAKSLANQQQQDLPKQFVLAIRPNDGKILWKTEVGTFRQGQPMYYYYMMKDTNPQPRLILQAGAIYVDTHAGVLARLDAESGSLEWGYGYKTDAVQGQDRFMFYYQPPAEPTTASAPPLRLEDSLAGQGGAVGPDPGGRPQPDEGDLGAADLEVVASARLRRPGRLLRRPRDQRHGHQVEGTALGHPDSRRQPGQPGPGPTRRDLATHPARDLRDRPQVGQRPADLPRGRPRRGRRQPLPDRSLADLRLQSHDLGLSSTGEPRRRPGARRSRDHQPEGFA